MRASEDTRHAVRMCRSEVIAALKDFLSEHHNLHIPDNAELYLEQHKAGDEAASFIWNTKVFK